MHCRTLGLYSAFRACRAIVLRSKRQSRLTVATMFLEKFVISLTEQIRITQEDTYCKVGVIPLGPWLVMAAGVAAGVAGVTPFPFAAC